MLGKLRRRETKHRHTHSYNHKLENDGACCSPDLSDVRERLLSMILYYLHHHYTHKGVIKTQQTFFEFQNFFAFVIICFKICKLWKHQILKKTRSYVFIQYSEHLPLDYTAQLMQPTGLRQMTTLDFQISKLLLRNVSMAVLTQSKYYELTSIRPTEKKYERLNSKTVHF